MWLFFFLSLLSTFGSWILFLLLLPSSSSSSSLSFLLLLLMLLLIWAAGGILARLIHTHTHNYLLKWVTWPNIKNSQSHSYVAVQPSSCIVSFSPQNIFFLNSFIFFYHFRCLVFVHLLLLLHQTTILLLLSRLDHYPNQIRRPWGNSLSSVVVLVVGDSEGIERCRE